MKSFFLVTGIASLAISTVPAAAAVVTLLSSSTISVSVQSGHLDAYDFPLSLVNPANPMVSLSIRYNNQPDYPGAHSIVSTHVLFNPADISSQSVILNDSDHFETTLVFNQGITGIIPSGEGALGGAGNFGFAAVHSSYFGDSTIRWTATYLDGSSAQEIGGTVPEPSGFAIFATAGVLGMARRRRVAADKS